MLQSFRNSSWFLHHWKHHLCEQWACRGRWLIQHSSTKIRSVNSLTLCFKAGWKTLSVSGFFRHDSFALLQIVEVWEQREKNSCGICLIKYYWSGQMKLILLTSCSAVNWWFSTKVMWHAIVKSKSSTPFKVV